MKSIVFVALVAAFTGDNVINELRDYVISAKAESLTGQPLVDYVNANQHFFQTKLNSRYAGMSAKRKRKMINGVAPSIPTLAAELDKEGRVTHKSSASNIPEFFDARLAWPYCRYIGFIRDQSTCGSCWAIASSGVISDRICISSGGRLQYSISAADLLTCCGSKCSNGCSGGNPLEAMKFWVSHGVVTGSDYEAKQGCKPYLYPPCEHHNNNTVYTNCEQVPEHGDPPSCSKKCQSGYPLTYQQDKHYGKSVYGLSTKVVDIQKEIILNGPVEASFSVYEDFEQYSSGVYVHRAGKYIGLHAVKVIGWGRDGSIPYWVAANSWNTHWGENGLFRIIRGRNEVGFEEAMIAGLP